MKKISKKFAVVWAAAVTVKFMIEEIRKIKKKTRRIKV